MIQYDCGCKFEKSEPGGLVFDPDNIPLDCQKTWDLICSGNTTGVWQLESNLGKSYAKQVKPRTIEELSDLIALIRPGALEGVHDGDTIINHYIKKRDGREPLAAPHKLLEPILAKTNQEMVYQEQILLIAQKLAGFTLGEADILRKAIGKKKVKLMEEVRIKFIEGCKKTGLINEQDSIGIFDMIEKSARYLFNLSHSVSYAINSYITAYSKSHFPKEFFTAYLTYARYKPKPFLTIAELVQNARSMNIDVYPPDVENRNLDFDIINDKIYFGLVNIKGIGENMAKQFFNQIGGNIDKNWLNFLFKTALNVNKRCIKAMIGSGAVKFFGLPRLQMLYEHEITLKFTKKELDWIIKNALDNSPSLENILIKMLEDTPGRGRATSNKNRHNIVKGLLFSLKDPPYSLEDSPEWISGIEKSLLGISLTCGKIDRGNIEHANTTCRDFISGKQRTGIILACEIDEIREVKTKDNKDMAFLKVSDNDGTLESVATFPQEWKEYNDILIENNAVLIFGERSRKGTLVVKKCFNL